MGGDKGRRGVQEFSWKRIRKVEELEQQDKEEYGGRHKVHKDNITFIGQEKSLNLWVFCQEVWQRHSESEIWDRKAGQKSGECKSNAMQCKSNAKAMQCNAMQFCKYWSTISSRWKARGSII